MLFVDKTLQISSGLFSVPIGAHPAEAWARNIPLITKQVLLAQPARYEEVPLEIDRRENYFLSHPLRPPS